MPLFSKRNLATPDTYRYGIPPQVRVRLLQAIRMTLESTGSNVTLNNVLHEMRDTILQCYGCFRSSGNGIGRFDNDPAVEHFLACSDEEVMDFLQMCFETRWNCGRQATVEAINRVLEEENIGFELTPYTETVTEGGTLYGQLMPQLKTIHPHLPTAIRKDEKALHAQTVKPCLQRLSNPRFQTANEELLNAFAEYRQGKYSDAITDAGAAFESVLKTICTINGWLYDKDRDTCSTLLDICREKQLFHPFYKQILEGTATVRNKMGDAHGKGPQPEYPATKEFADHMLYMVCNNINLLIDLAKL